jgi:biotin operon repressor
MLLLKVKVIFGCGLLMVSATSGGQGQSANDYQALVGRFGINLPDSCDYKTLTTRLAGQAFSAHVYKWMTPEGTFTITFGKGGQVDLDRPEHTNAFLTDLRDKYVAIRQRQNGKILTERSVAFGGHAGFELVDESAGVNVDFRAFVIGNRYYTLAIARNAQQLEFRTKGDQILASFRLLSDSEVGPLGDAIIEGMVPPPLPQEPVVPRIKSDAQDKNLFGNVKRVLTQEERPIEGHFLGQKSAVEMEDFDQRGYLVRKVHYIDGLPFKALGYGYLHGDRVFRKGFGTGQEIFTKVTHETPSTIHKLKYKYDSSGQLAEMSQFQENGKLEESYSYRNEGRKRETTLTTSSYTIWKTTALLDDHGNPVEESRTEYYEYASPDYYVTERAVTQISPSSGTPIDKIYAGDLHANPNKSIRVMNPVGSKSLQKAGEKRYWYTYKYDSHGNWTERINSEIDKSGKAASAIEITYRVMTYYEQH